MTSNAHSPPKRPAHLREGHQLYRLWVEDEISELDGYLRIVEGMLEDAKIDEFGKVKEAWRSLPRHLPESRRNEYWHNNFPYYWQQIFVPQFRFSFVPWSLSVIEFHLDLVCRSCQEAAKIQVGWKDIKTGSTLEKAQRYLIDCLRFSHASDATWEKLKSLYRIRNTVAHSAGCALNKDDRQQLSQHVGKFQGIALANNGDLTIKREFCQGVVAVVSDFLYYLVEQRERFLERARQSSAG